MLSNTLSCLIESAVRVLEISAAQSITVVLEGIFNPEFGLDFLRASKD